MDMTNLLGEAVGIIIGETTMNISIHEDNFRALILEETVPPQFTPQSKHCVSKTFGLVRRYINVE